jgi:DNA polymerase III epsilon subunit-like protein
MSNLPPPPPPPPPPKATPVAKAPPPPPPPPAPAGKTAESYLAQLTPGTVLNPVQESCGFVCIDTETGGLNKLLHPLLSMAVVILDGDLNEINGFSEKMKPPEGTVLEIPIVAHIGVEPKIKREVMYYLDVHTGQELNPGQIDPRNDLIITSYAAEVNGFVKTLPGNSGYDFTAVSSWMRQGRTYDQVQDTYISLLKQCFRTAPIPVAHNASFDEKFVTQWLPRLVDNLQKTWFCTYAALRALRTSKGLKNQKGDCTLSSLVKYAGKTLSEEEAHEALADTRGCAEGFKWLKEEGAWDLPEVRKKGMVLPS